MDRCTVCGRSAEEDEKFTYLPLYVIGSEGTTACEDCRMDITNFTRNLMSSMNRATRRVRQPAKGIGFGELIKIGRSQGDRPSIQMTMAGRVHVGPDDRIMNLNADTISISAFADQIKHTGLVETADGDVFKWNARVELWEEEYTGKHEVLRVFPAAESGFPDAPLAWRFRFPQSGAALMEHRPDGSIHATLPTDGIIHTG